MGTLSRKCGRRNRHPLREEEHLLVEGRAALEEDVAERRGAVARREEEEPRAALRADEPAVAVARGCIVQQEGERLREVDVERERRRPEDVEVRREHLLPRHRERAARRPHREEHERARDDVAARPARAPRDRRRRLQRRRRRHALHRPRDRHDVEEAAAHVDDLDVPAVVHDRHAHQHERERREGPQREREREVHAQRDVGRRVVGREELPRVLVRARARPPLLVLQAQHEHRRREEEHAHRHHLQVRHRDVGVVAVDLGEDAVDERGVADRWSDRRGVHRRACAQILASQSQKSLAQDRQSALASRARGRAHDEIALCLAVLSPARAPQ